MPSHLEDIMRVMETAAKALNLPGISSNVSIGKLPAAEEELDTLPLLIICPADEDETMVRASFEGDYFIVYPIDVVAISKGKRLLAAEGNVDPNDDLFRQFDWRQRLRDKFHNPQTWQSVAVVRNARVGPGKPVDRTRLNQNYDYARLTARVATQEKP